MASTFKTPRDEPTTDWPTEFSENSVREPPSRHAVLERFLDRTKPRARHSVDDIITTGHRLLARLAESELVETRAAGGESWL